MRPLLLLSLGCGLMFHSLSAQVNWMIGGALRSSVQTSNGLGLQTVSDREWVMGFDKPWGHGSKKMRLGIWSVLRLRSPFYELDASLPYYPLKGHIPTYRFESAQLFPFFCFPDLLLSSDRFRLGFRVGPVFSFHAGNYISSATARTQPGQVPIILYRLGVRHHPMGIPFLRSQLSFSWRFRKGRHCDWVLDPFVQMDLGDRSRIWYRVVPDDHWRSSEGWLRNGKGSFGLLCGFRRRH